MLYAPSKVSLLPLSQPLRCGLGIDSPASPHLSAKGPPRVPAAPFPQAFPLWGCGGGLGTTVTPSGGLLAPPSPGAAPGQLMHQEDSEESLLRRRTTEATMFFAPFDRYPRGPTCPTAHGKHTCLPLRPGPEKTFALLFLYSFPLPFCIAFLHCLLALVLGILRTKQCRPITVAPGPAPSPSTTEARRRPGPQCETHAPGGSAAASHRFPSNGGFALTGEPHSHRRSSTCLFGAPRLFRFKRRREQAVQEGSKQEGLRKVAGQAAR